MRYNILCLALTATLLIALTGCGTGIKPPRGVKPVIRTMEITGYDQGKESCNWKRNWRGKPVIASGPNKGQRKKIGITASGTKAKKGTIAADTTHYPFGTVIYIPGYGLGRVEDRGGAIKGNKLDLFYKSRKDALKWGRQTKKVKIWLPKRR